MDPQAPAVNHLAFDVDIGVEHDMREVLEASNKGLELDNAVVQKIVEIDQLVHPFSLGLTFHLFANSRQLHRLPTLRQR